MIVAGNRVRLIPVVVNFVTNAATFTPSSGALRVSLTHEDRRVTPLRVRDTGPDIPAHIAGARSAA